MTVIPPTKDNIWQVAESLELRSVRERFVYKKGRWWSFWNDVEKLEKEYRQFLYLIAANPEKTVVPWSQDLDDFWHEHILDTAKYATDCKWILGDFIHHNPHLPHGTKKHADAAHETQKMYRAAFKAKATGKNTLFKKTPGCSSDMHIVFCGSSTSGSTHHSHGRFHVGGHSDSGHHAGGHDAGHGSHGGHGCGGHGGGHGCGGHGGGH